MFESEQPEPDDDGSQGCLLPARSALPATRARIDILAGSAIFTTRWVVTRFVPALAAVKIGGTMTSTLTSVTNLLTDDFPGSALRTNLWQPLAPGHEFKGQTWTFSNTLPYTAFNGPTDPSGGGFPTVSNNTARFALQTWDRSPNKPPNEHAFLGTEALSVGAWNPISGGLSFEARFKFSGDGTGNLAALNQGGMIIGFFSYEQNPPTEPSRLDFHTEIDFEVFTSNFKNPALNQISTNVFNGARNLTIQDPVHNTNVVIAYDPLSFPNNPLPNAEYHKYRFEWFPNWINFYIDDKLLRTVTNPDSLPDPSRDQRLHLNLWGQATNVGYAWGDWTGNPVGDRTLGPALTAAAGKTYYADFQAVRVDRLASTFGTANADTLTGTAANDGMDGGAGDDTLAGGDGDDTIMGGAGNDAIAGDSGSDTALYAGARARYTVASTADKLTVTDTVTGDVDTLTNVEFLGFSDKVFKVGDQASNAMVGTEDNDAFEAVGGDDTLGGGAGDDTLIGGDGNDTIDGGTGNNTVSGGAGSDVFDFRLGATALHDTLPDLNRDAIAGFGSDDGLEIQGVLIGRAALNVANSGHAATVSVGGSSFELTGDFSGGDFMTVPRGIGPDENTLVTFVPFLPSLSEGVSVNSASINGVSNEPFLFGDGSVSFSVELKSATSAFHNTLGVYAVAADGTIGDAHILFSDTLNVAGPARTVNLGTPSDGARLAFFLIQDGFSAYGQLPNDLTFVTPGTNGRANVAVDDAVTLHSATLGDLVAVPVFHSDAVFNRPLGTVQVLSGVASGGRELQMGFEDVSTVTGDSDFQDVVIGIRALNDDVLVF